MHTTRGSRVAQHLFDPSVGEALLARAAEEAPSYTTAHPFPHAVMDDFLPAEVLEDVLRAYPGPEDLDWQRFAAQREHKLAFDRVEALPEPIRDTLHFLNTAPMLRFLEQLTSIDALLPDPYFFGGGLHQIERGGYLGVHADFNRLPRFRLDRRLNLILFLNKDWEEEFGGHLELWTPDMGECARRVLPVFNRCVVFSTTDNAMHGHPTPLTCPDGRYRRSLATYYYTNGRPAEEASDPHSTLFRPRPSERNLVGRAKTLLSRWLPPVLTDWHYRRQRRRRGY